MKYFFILGKNPTLSVAELAAVFSLHKEKDEHAAGSLLAENVFLLEVKEKIDAQSLIKRLGGIIKIGEMLSEASADKEDILKKIIPALEAKKEGKFKFGISYYGKNKFNVKPLGMEIKKFLKERGTSSRWVISREPTLSSVVVEQNKLVAGGAEIVLIRQENKILIGRTLSVQPFKELSFRDYGRPGRDDYSGMLPPKLAQILLNLSRTPADGNIMDPFCGSGTIITEAILMGCKNLIGADISQKAIKDTEVNIKWIAKNYQLPIINYQLFNKSAVELSKLIKLDSVDAIVTEPYLGPQRGRIEIKKTVAELEKLYSKSLMEFFKILKSNGRIVMIWPVFRKTPNIEHITLYPDLNDLKIINPIPENLRNSKKIQLTGRNTIIYGRPDQKVWREIVVLEK